MSAGLLASAALLLPSAAIAQTLDLNNMSLTLSTLDQSPGTPYTLVRNGRLTLSLPSTLVYAGALQNGANRLSLTIANNGTLLLTGTANTYSGITTISTGATLAAGATNAFSANSVLSGGAIDLRGFSQDTAGMFGSTVVNNTGTASAILSINTASGLLRSSNAGILETAGAISVVKTGTGRQNFNAASTYTGGTSLVAGTLGVGTGAALGSGAITFNGPATLATTAASISIANAINLATDGIFDGGPELSRLNGAISGAGRLTLTGAGTIEVTGANTYTGGTSLAAARISVGTGAALGTGLVTAVAGSGLGTTGGSVTLDNAIFLQTLLQVTAPAPGSVLALNGPISGNGGVWLRFGDGTLRLGSANSYTGTTDLGRGTLALGNDLALGNSILSVVGASTLQADAAGLNIANNVVLSGGDLFKVDTNGNDLTLSGLIRDRSNLAPASLTKIGSGVLTLTRGNLYSLGTIIKAGTVAVDRDVNLGRTTGPLTLDGGDLRVIGAGFTTARPITLTGVGGAFDIADAAGNLVVTQAITGAGTLIKNGAGTLTLAAANSYGGGTLLSAGTLAAGDSGALGGGTLTIAGGILTASAPGVSLGNAVVLAQATNTVDASTNPLTLTGAIAGMGSLTKTGAGTLTLTNAANSYAGGTIVAGGAIEVISGTALGTGGVALGNGTSLIASAPMTIANAFTLTGSTTVAPGDNALTLAGAIGGTGSLTKTGAGALTLGAANSYAGGTTVAAGTVVGSAASFGSGGIVDNGAVTFAQPTDGSFAGVISGTGSVTKTGAGNLTLSGASTVAGPTTVAAGRLTVTGSLTPSAVTVASGASLAGTGTVGALTAQAGSTITPGTAPGATATLAVAGAASFAPGSTFAVDINPASVDLLRVGGAASLAGNLTLTLGSGQYLFNNVYTLVSAGSLTGTFSPPPLNGFGPAFAPVLVYSGTTLTLRLVPNTLDRLSAGLTLTPNQRNRANAFDAAVAAGFNPQGFFALFNQGAGLPAALDQLTGELHSAGRRVAMEDNRHVREAAFDRLSAALGGLSGTASTAAVTTTRDERSYSLWGRIVASSAKADTTAITSSFDHDLTGAIVGFDAGFGGFKAGALFFHTASDLDFDILGNSEVESTGGGLYGGYRSDGGIAAGIGGSIADVKIDSNRSITTVGYAQGLQGSADGTSKQAFAEIAYDLVAAAETRLEPFARFAYVDYRAKRFSETGGIAALSAPKQSYDTSFTTVGGRGAVALGPDGALALKASAGWQRTTGDRAPEVLLAIAGTTSFASIRAAPLDRNAFAAEAGAEYRLGRTASFSLSYSGVMGKNNRDHAGRATLTFGF